MMYMPLQYSQAYSNFSTWTTSALTERTTTLISFPDPQKFIKKNAVMSSFNSLPILVWLLHLLVILSLLIVFVLGKPSQKRRSWRSSLMRLVATNFDELIPEPLNTREAILLLLYVLQIFILKTIMCLLIKTDMVVMDASKFIDTLDQLEERTEYSGYTIDTSSLSETLRENPHLYPSFGKRLRFCSSIAEADDVFSSLMAKSAGVSLSHMVAFAPTMNIGYFLKTVCMMADQYELRSWIGESVMPRLNFLMFNKKLSLTHRELFEFT